MTQIPPRRPPTAGSRSRKKLAPTSSAETASPADPAPTDPAPTGPAPTDPALAEAVPVEPVPVEPVPIEPDRGGASAGDTSAGDTSAGDTRAGDTRAAGAPDQAPVAAAIAAASTTDSPAPEAPPRRERIRKPITEEQRLRYNAARRHKWTERRRLLQGAAQFNWRQNKLIEAYLRLGTVRPAAQEAGYAPSSRGSAAALFLRRPDVAAIIAARRAEMRRQSEVTVERVIGELAKLAFADPRDLFTPDGKLKPLHELDDASAASISALEVLAVAGGRRATTARSRTAGGKAVARAVDAGAADAGTANASTGDADGDGADGSVESSGDVVLELRKIKRWDKTKALELLGRYLGLFKDRLELGVSADLAGAIEAARKRSQSLAAPGAATVIEATVVEGRVVDATDAEEVSSVEDV